jgi:hypothetical protein
MPICALRLASSKRSTFSWVAFLCGTLDAAVRASSSGKSISNGRKSLVSNCCSVSICGVTTSSSSVKGSKEVDKGVCAGRGDLGENGEDSPSPGAPSVDDIPSGAGAVV